MVGLKIVICGHFLSGRPVTALQPVSWEASCFGWLHQTCSCLVNMSFTHMSPICHAIPICPSPMCHPVALVIYLCFCSCFLIHRIWNILMPSTLIIRVLLRLLEAVEIMQTDIKRIKNSQVDGDEPCSLEGDAFFLTAMLGFYFMFYFFIYCMLCFVQSSDDCSLWLRFPAAEGRTRSVVR